MSGSNSGHFLALTNLVECSHSYSNSFLIVFWLAFMLNDWYWVSLHSFKIHWNGMFVCQKSSWKPCKLPYSLGNLKKKKVGCLVIKFLREQGIRYRIKWNIGSTLIWQITKILCFVDLILGVDAPGYDSNRLLYT